MSAGDRVRAAAQAAGISLDTGTATQLAVLVERVASRLAGEGGEKNVDARSRPLPSGSEMGSRETVVAAVQAGLDRARPSVEGGAYVLVDREGALAAAMLNTRAAVSPLGGMPFAVKDLIAVAGQPLGAGSAVREDAPPMAADAAVVAAVRHAGGILIGLTALHEFAFGVTGVNEYSGTPRNPADPTRVPGGSSSGSAVAVAEGSARIAVGTDTGGSVRIPAALCGVAGFKPALGTYPTAGVFPLSPTLDHIGFLARSVADLQRVHLIFSASPLYEQGPLRRVGLLRHNLEEATTWVQNRFDALLRRLGQMGVALVEVDDAWPDPELVFATSTAIMFAEAAAIHRLELQARGDRYGQDVRNRLLQGLAIPAADYVLARQARERIQDQVGRALAGVDCVLGPTVKREAPTFKEAANPAVAGDLVAFTRVGNIAGVPALSLPLPGEGLPVGAQIIAGSNECTLQIGVQLEKVAADL